MGITWVVTNKVIITAGLRAQVVAALPQHVTRVTLVAGLTAQAVAALPQHVTRVDIGRGVSAKVVRLLQKHLKIEQPENKKRKRDPDIDVIKAAKYLTMFAKKGRNEGGPDNDSYSIADDGPSPSTN